MNPLYIQFAQDVRGYSLALLLVSASCFFFVRGIQQVDPPAPFLLDGLHRRHRPGGLHQLLGRARPRRRRHCRSAFLPPGRIPWRRVLASAVALVVLLVPLGLLIESTDSAGVELGVGLLGRPPVHPHPVVRSPCRARPARAGCRRRGRGGRRAGAPAPRHRCVFARQWPLFFTLCWLVVPVAAVVMLSLVDKPLLVVRYLMVSLPAAVLLVALVIDRVASLARRGAWRRGGRVARHRRRPSSAVGAAQWYSKGGPQDFRSAVALHCRPGPAGRRRAGLRALRAHPGRVVHGASGRPPSARCTPSTRRRRGAWTRWPSTAAWPSAPSAIEQAASRYQRIWLLSATADLSLYPAQAAAVDAALRRAGFTPAGTTRVPRGGGHRGGAAVSRPRLGMSLRRWAAWWRQPRPATSSIRPGWPGAPGAGAGGSARHAGRRAPGTAPDLTVWCRPTGRRG